MTTSYINRMTPQAETLAVEVEHQGQHYVVHYRPEDWFSAAIVVAHWPLPQPILKAKASEVLSRVENEWRQAVAEHSKPQPSLWQRGWAWLKARAV